MDKEDKDAKSLGDQSVVTNFEVLPVAADLLEDDELAEHFISAINISSNDFNGDGLTGYQDQELHDVKDREFFPC